MQYKVVTTCYFAGRLFEAGEIVTLSDDVKAPEHLEALEPKKEATAPVKRARKSSKQ